ncbi:hypothetical protein [Streptomyces sp. NPDC096324]|uniref:hypothetical protein n=1 Tax=Streptomyces sp. NPDC096324 TaxID=3366085 RepID=UPI00380BCCC7
MNDPGRYHLLLAVEGRPAMHGWWNEQATAERKFRSWIGECGSMPGAHITLVDEVEERVIHRWPDED